MTCLYERASEAFTKNNIKKVSSYKEMCKILQETDHSKHPDLKRRQLEAWKICFSWKMNGNKFERIKMYSTEEYFYNLLNKKYYNTVLYTFCALLNQYGKVSNLPYLVATKSELAIALGFYNEDFKAARFGDTTKLLEIENGVLDKFGSKYDYLKPYKQLIKSKKDNKEVTAFTSKVFDDFSSHQNKNVNNRIEKLLKELENMRIISVQKERIGGFIDKNFIEQNNIDLNKIYQKNGNFYFDIIRDNNQKTTLLIPYEERVLTTQEIATQLKIDGQAILAQGCVGFNEILNKGVQATEKFYTQTTQNYREKMGALFIYDSYKIIFDQEFMSQSSQIYLQRTQDLFSVTSIQSSLKNTNAVSKDMSIANKERRQSKQTVDKRYQIGENKNQDKEDELKEQQKTELYLNRAFNNTFINIETEKFFSKDTTLENFSEFKYSIWNKLFNRSLKKQQSLIALEKENISNLEDNSKSSQNQCHSLDVLSFDNPNFMNLDFSNLTPEEINFLLNSVNSVSSLNLLIENIVKSDWESTKDDLS